MDILKHMAKTDWFITSIFPILFEAQQCCSEVFSCDCIVHSSFQEQNEVAAQNGLKYDELASLPVYEF